MADDENKVDGDVIDDETGARLVKIEENEYIEIRDGIAVDNRSNVNRSNVNHSNDESKVTIVKIKDVLPPQPKELNDSRGLATADYQEYLEDEWIKQLKVKYPVVVNEVVLQQLSAGN